MAQKNMNNGMSRRMFIGAAGLGAAGLLAGCTQQQQPAASTAKPVILVVSFGTSYNSSRHITIGAIESAIREHFGYDYDVRRAFTADTIIDILKEREGIEIDNVEAALDRCVNDGVKQLVVQPTHLMDGFEFTDLSDLLDEYRGKFDSVALGRPLLDTDDDFSRVADALAEAMGSYDDGETAIVFMGHGTEADSNSVYQKMQETFASKGHDTYFVGTVEAEPTCEDVIAQIQEAGLTRAVLSPLMVVAGDHATNDMSDREDPESWASKFAAAGIEPTCLLVGLGQYEAIDAIYVEHAEAASKEL